MQLLPTSLIGSYAQPDWLLNREKLASRFPPGVRAQELWHIDPQWLEQSQDDATVLGIHDQERAGFDIATDGEMRRESYSSRFATALDGVVLDNHGSALDRSGAPQERHLSAGIVHRSYLQDAGLAASEEACRAGYVGIC